MSDEKCRELMNLTVIVCKESESSSSYWLKDCTGMGQYHELDGLLPKSEIIQKYIENRGSFLSEEIERIKLRASRKKVVLETSLYDLKEQIKNFNKELQTISGDKLRELQIQKQIKLLEKELRQKEEKQFFEQMQIDVGTEEEILNITSIDRFSTTAKRMFVIRLSGKTN